jgi:hypothetical protein
MQASSRRPIGLRAPRSGPCAGRAQALDLDVWTSRDADGPIGGRHGRHLEQRIPGSGSKRVVHARSGVASLVVWHVCRYQKTTVLSIRGRTKEAYSKRELYHRLQVRRLQRDVQLTGPLALGEVHRDGGGGVAAAMATAGRWQGTWTWWCARCVCALRRQLNDAAIGLHRGSSIVLRVYWLTRGWPALLAPSLLLPTQKHRSTEAHTSVPGAVVLAAALCQVFGS